MWLMKRNALYGILLCAAGVAPSSALSGTSTCQDRDGDGYGLDCKRGDDCNDRDRTVSPSAVESCNFRDDDCNGLVDDNKACTAPALDPTPVRVNEGPFSMGSDHGAPDEKPVHAVHVSELKIDRYEVTNRRYRECVSLGACSRPALATSHRRAAYFDDEAFDDYPVIFVSWNQAAQFCKFAGGRLPTEAEWEKAARGPAPDVREYPWGKERPDCRRANLGGPQSCVGDTDRVGRRLDGASPFGAMDMAGNVWEWVQDWYARDYYRHSERQDPQGPPKGTLKVMRGGCWESQASSLRVACRRAELPDAWADNVGFRCVYQGGR